MLLPVIAGLLAGSLTAIISAVMVARLLGASTSTQLSLAPKSVTTPIAMGIAERIGGIPSLTAVLEPIHNTAWAWAASSCGTMAV